MENYQKIIKSFSLKKSLNHKIWDSPTDPNSAKLKENIRKKLLEIANQFQDFIGLEIIVSDIHMTGSLANFNWSEFSDVDLHLIVDFSQFSDKQKELFTELFKLKKTLFNLQHNIKIYNYDVELYVQDKSEEHTSSGVYSVLFDEWIVIPKKEKFEIDKKILLNKVNSWITKIDETIEQSKEENNLSDSLDFLNKLRKKIKEYRSTGLSKGGEFSYENLVFKFLRRNGYIEKLFNFENKIIDKKLSLETLNENTENVTKELQLPIEGSYSPSGAQIYGAPRSGGRKHAGVDLACPRNTKVYSPSDGEVKDSAFRYDSCGGTLLIDHGNGVKTRYCHMKELKVNVNDKIKKGDLVGLSGGYMDPKDGGKKQNYGKGDKHDSDKGRGNSKSAHLHWELYKGGSTVNPENYFDFKNRKIKKSVFTNDVVEDQPWIANDGSFDIENIYNRVKDNLSDIFDFGNDDGGGDKGDDILKKGQEALDKAKKEAEEKMSNVTIENDALATIYFINRFKHYLEIEKQKSEIEKQKSVYEKIKLPSHDKSFYESVLKNIGAPVSKSNLVFLYSWASLMNSPNTYNPLGVSWSRGKDPNETKDDQGFINFSTEAYGLEGLTDMLNTQNFDCVQVGLINNDDPLKISKCFQNFDKDFVTDLHKTINDWKKGGDVYAPQMKRK